MNSSSEKKDWSSYYDLTRSGPPRPLLVEAVEYVANRNRAIDIGGGALRDTRYLLRQGFDVTVIDKSSHLREEAQKIDSDQLHAYVTSFEEFDFGNQQYDLAAALFALPFNPPGTFNEVFTKIKQSLVAEGIFCGQFFGVHDSWVSRESMTFHTKEQVNALLADMEIIRFEEKEEDGATADGTAKHWHMFHVIARKR